MQHYKATLLQLKNLFKKKFGQYINIQSVAIIITFLAYSLKTIPSLI